MDRCSLDMSRCPEDIYPILFTYYNLFQQRHAIDRVEDFRALYASIWAEIMNDICANTPKYRIKLRSCTNQIMVISIYSPDCVIQRGFGAWQISCTRQIRSSESPHRIIRNEIITPHELY